MTPIATRDGAGNWTVHDSKLYTGYVAQGQAVTKMTERPKQQRKTEQQPELAVINDSANYDQVVRSPRPYVLSDGTVIDFTDRERYPLATDHQRFAPIPPAE